MKKTRSPSLTEQRLQLVLETLDNWNGKLTWDLLIAAVAKVSGITYSRFTFAEYPQIANAFAFKKEALRESKSTRPPEPADKRLRAAAAQMERLQSAMGRLKQENMLLKEQFVTWAHNAERKGVTLMMLNAPLPKPERERSKPLK